jgi:uncharacterized protein (DUF2147 family)
MQRKIGIKKIFTKGGPLHNIRLSEVGMKKLFILSFLLLFCCSLMADNIGGFWQTIDQKTNKPSSVVAIYPYQGKYYGRIIGSYNDKGEIDDSIYAPKGRATGIPGNPYYSGFDFVYNATYEGAGRFSGYVVDPRDGKIYDAELWRSGANLILRGELFMFGRNEVWPPFPDSGFNDKFKKPDLSTFVPVIPSAAE